MTDADYDIQHSGGSGGPFGLLATVVGLWSLYAHSYVWEVATSLQSPLDVLGMAAAVVLFVWGALAAIGIAIAVLLGLGVVAVMVSQLVS